MNNKGTSTRFPLLTALVIIVLAGSLYFWQDRSLSREVQESSGTITQATTPAPETLSAYPTSGDAPLSVYFSYPHTTEDPGVISFGDGTSGEMYHEIPPCVQVPNPPKDYCQGHWAAQHIYTRPGIYSAILTLNTETSLTTRITVH